LSLLLGAMIESFLFPDIPDILVWQLLVMHAVGMESSSNPELCVSVDLSCWDFDIWDV